MIPRSVVLLTVIGTIVALVITTATAFISEGTGISYAWFSIPSFITYAAVGYLGGRRHSLAAATWAGIIVSFIDCTIGLWIAWVIGPGHMKADTPQDQLTIVMTVKFVMAINALVVLGGVGVGRRYARTSAPE